MNVATITMDREQARRKLYAARARLEKGHDEEYKALAQGYAALAEGLPVIDLRRSVLAGGIDPAGRPRLAVARADRRKVWFGWEGHFACFRAAQALRGAHRQRWPELIRRFSFAEHPELPGNRWNISASALVPMVPPEIRLEDPAPLNRRWILWEAEWSPEPPVDPMLLKHLGGDLYAVTGAWDLTELERTVMAGRRHG